MLATAVTADTVIGDDFRIVGPLRAGGMGAVYVAEQLSTTKLRAVKLMHTQLVADDEQRARFVREARVAAAVDSDHVVEIIGAGVERGSGTPWIAMELLEGDDLATYVRARRRLATEEAAEVMSQICHAIAAAHDAGIVHRDLKPQNVFMAKTKRRRDERLVKVLDFGIAKVVAESTHAPTAAVGSPAWMAPEQTEAGARIGPEADVWALGLLAFWMFTGRSYWKAAGRADGSVQAVMREMIFEPLASGSRRARELGVEEHWPAALDRWLARCLERRPRRRFASGGHAFTGFTRALEGLEHEEGAPPSTGVASAPPTVPSRDAAPSTVVEGNPRTMATRAALHSPEAARHSPDAAPHDDDGGEVERGERRDSGSDRDQDEDNVEDAVPERASPNESALLRSEDAPTRVDSLERSAPEAPEATAPPTGETMATLMSHEGRLGLDDTAQPVVRTRSARPTRTLQLAVAAAVIAGLGYWALEPKRALTGPQPASPAVATVGASPRADAIHPRLVAAQARFESGAWDDAEAEAEAVLAELAAEGVTDGVVGADAALLRADARARGLVATLGAPAKATDIGAWTELIGRTHRELAAATALYRAVAGWSAVLAPCAEAGHGELFLRLRERNREAAAKLGPTEHAELLTLLRRDATSLLEQVRARATAGPEGGRCGARLAALEASLAALPAFGGDAATEDGAASFPATSPPRVGRGRAPASPASSGKVAPAFNALSADTLLAQAKQRAIAACSRFEGPRGQSGTVRFFPTGQTTVVSSDRSEAGRCVINQMRVAIGPFRGETPVERPYGLNLKEP